MNFSLANPLDVNSTFEPWMMVLWALILGLVNFGLGRLFHGLLKEKDRKEKDSWVLTLSLGQASLGLICTALIATGTLEFGFPLLLALGTALGVRELQHVIPPFEGHRIKNFFSNPLHIGLASITLGVIVVHFFTILAPVGGQESFQYHYFLPVLYLEQQTLQLQSYELYDALMNVWGLETLFSFSMWAGGLPAILIQMWWLYLLFLLQIWQASRWFFKSSTTATWALVFSSLCTIYSYFLWWTKPELPLTGFTALILCHWWRKGDRSAHIGDGLVSAVLISFALSLKISSLVLLPAFIVIAIICGRTHWKWWAFALICSVVFSLPWIVFVTLHDGAMGALPVDNPAHFAAPMMEASPWMEPPLQKYFSNLWFTIGLYKPASHLFILGIPLMVWKWRANGMLLAGVTMNLSAAALLMKPDTPYADEFRYVCFSLFVIPMGAALLVEFLSRWKWIPWLVLLVVAGISIKRSHTQINETLRHQGSWLKGQRSLGEAMAREGHLAYQKVKAMKTIEGQLGPEKILHIGHGNVAVHGPEVIHVGSWSRRYPLWQHSTAESLEQWCRKQGIATIIFERWRYRTYARGFGDPIYVDNAQTSYYIGVNKTMDLIDSWQVSQPSERYGIYRVPRNNKPIPTLKNRH